MDPLGGEGIEQQPWGLAFSFRELLFQLQRSLPTLPCLQPALARLLLRFSVPLPLLPPARSCGGSWQVPQACPCCSVLLCLPFPVLPTLTFPYSTHSLGPHPLQELH